MDTYEKKYKEAFAHAREIHRNEVEKRRDMEFIFPELAESEDEMIRKWLIGYFNQYIIDGMPQVFGNGLNVKDVIAWLKKQGEQKPQGKSALEAIKEERVDNQNCVKPADKVEPKFHEGEWITNGDYTWKIVEVEPLDYILQSQDGNIVDDTISHVDEQFHSFTIEDAKPGDMLCYKDEVFLYKHDIKNCTLKETSFGGMVYYCCYDGKRFITDSMYSLTEKGKDDIHPATKEQRDFLFQKITEAGYEWDANKLELKKIDMQELVKQNPAWSKEDEEMLKSVIATCELAEQERNSSPAKHLLEMQLNWLKAIKQRIGG